MVAMVAVVALVTMVAMVTGTQVPKRQSMPAIRQALKANDCLYLNNFLFFRKVYYF
jgi:hypothetical protein